MLLDMSEPDAEPKNFDWLADELDADDRVVILGQAGSGKTVTVSKLILRRLSDRSPEQRVPVRLSLANWNSDMSPDEWFASQIAQDYGLPLQRAKDLVEDRRIQPILDGLDEMDPDESLARPTRALSLIEWLNHEYTDAGRPAGVILTCREARYRSLAQLGETLQPARQFRILPLAPAQIRDYIERVFAGDATKVASWKPVLDTVEGVRGGPVWAVLATPWRLTLAITLVRSGRSPAQLFDVKPTETVALTAQRAEDELIASFIEATTILAEKLPNAKPPRYSVAQTTAYLRELARRLQLQARTQGHAPAAVSIVPYQLFASVPQARFAHGVFAGSIMALGCLALALDGIGPPTVWLESARHFFTAEIGLASRIFQEVVPALGLLGAPFLAGTLAAASPSPPVSKMRVGGRLSARVTQALPYAVTGAAVALLGYSLRLSPRTYSGYWLVEAIFVLSVVTVGVYLRQRWPARSGLIVSVVVISSVLLWSPFTLSVALGGAADAFLYGLAMMALTVIVVLAAIHCITPLALAINARLDLQAHRAALTALGVGAFVASATWLSFVLNDLDVETISLVTGDTFGVGLSTRALISWGVAAGLAAGVSAAYRRSAGDGALIGVITGLGVGLGGMLRIWTYGPFEDLFGLLLAFPRASLGALLAAVLLALVLRDPVPDGRIERSPHAALRDDLVNASWTAATLSALLFLFLISGLGDIFGIPFVGTRGAAAFALATGLAFGLFGRRAWFRYVIGVVFASARRQLPLQLGAFLRWAKLAGLLRLSGSAYQFRHLELQDWLLPQHSPESLQRTPEGVAVEHDGMRRQP